MTLRESHSKHLSYYLYAHLVPANLLFVQARYSTKLVLIKKTQ